MGHGPYSSFEARQSAHLQRQRRSRCAGM